MEKTQSNVTVRSQQHSWGLINWTSSRLPAISVATIGVYMKAYLQCAKHHPLEAPFLTVPELISKHPAPIQAESQNNQIYRNYEIDSQNNIKRERVLTLNSIYVAFFSSHCLSITANATQ